MRRLQPKYRITNGGKIVVRDDGTGAETHFTRGQLNKTIQNTRENPDQFAHKAAYQKEIKTLRGALRFLGSQVVGST